jgi:hypothetical protein
MKLRGLYSNYIVSTNPMASGGQAVLFDIPGTPLLYKQFKGRSRADQGVQDLQSRLRELCAIGHSVFVQRRRQPGDADPSSFCWPVDVIQQGGVPVGIVLPKATAPFYRDGSSRLRTLEFLYLYRTDPPNSYIRVRALLGALRAFAFLGQMQLVHGDVAPKNIVWASDPSPRVFVLDVDGVHRDGAPYWDHVQTPEWTDPRVLNGTIVGHDLKSDWYAMALLVLRTLLCSRFLLPTTSSPDLAELGAYLPNELSAALAKALGQPDPLRRPSPQEWSKLLSNHFFPSGKPNGAAFAAIDVGVARRRRWERRSGYLGPPFVELGRVLREGIGLVPAT